MEEPQSNGVQNGTTAIKVSLSTEDLSAKTKQLTKQIDQVKEQLNVLETRKESHWKTRPAVRTHPPPPAWLLC